MAEEIKQIRSDIAEIKSLLKENDGRYVSRSEFAPVKSVVFGLVGIILTAVVTALIYLVVQ